MNLKNFALVILTIAVFIVAIALARIALHGDEAFGTWKEDEHIAAVWQRGFEALRQPDRMVGDVLIPGDPRDDVALRAAQDELYDISQDEDITVPCRIYADFILVGLIALDEWGRYEDSIALGELNQILINNIPLTRSQCQLSI